MNRELIEALDQVDFQRALRLVESGADPNTRYLKPRPLNWRELLNQLVKHSKPSTNNSPTAFMIVCGAAYQHPGQVLYDRIPENRMHGPYIMQLVAVMLAHGADINARDSLEMTALLWASCQDLTDRMRFLLEHGAPIGSVNFEGYDALHYAACGIQPEAVKLLLKYHANPNVKDKYGLTALAIEEICSQNRAMYGKKQSPEVVRLLKAAGATR